jgi:ATP sulfurylase
MLSGGEKPPAELMRPEVAETVLTLQDAFIED